MVRMIVKTRIRRIRFVIILLTSLGIMFYVNIEF